MKPWYEYPGVATQIHPGCGGEMHKVVLWVHKNGASYPDTMFTEYYVAEYLGPLFSFGRERALVTKCKSCDAMGYLR